jgi:hypothetical protein
MCIKGEAVTNSAVGREANVKVNGATNDRTTFRTDESEAKHTSDE